MSYDPRWSWRARQALTEQDEGQDGGDGRELRAEDGDDRDAVGGTPYADRGRADHLADPGQDHQRGGDAGQGQPTLNVRGGRATSDEPDQARRQGNPDRRHELGRRAAGHESDGRRSWRRRHNSQQDGLSRVLAFPRHRDAIGAAGSVGGGGPVEGVGRQLDGPRPGTSGRAGSIDDRTTPTAMSDEDEAGLGTQAHRREGPPGPWPGRPRSRRWGRRWLTLPMTSARYATYRPLE